MQPDLHLFATEQFANQLEWNDWYVVSSIVGDILPTPTHIPIVMKHRVAPVRLPR